MLYRQRHDTFIRHYDDVGYIVNEGMLADRVVDPAGAVFLDALSRSPQSIEAITETIRRSFVDAPKDLIIDVQNFYGILEADGFIVSGNTPDELDVKDKTLSQIMRSPARRNGADSASVIRSERDTQSYLSEHFKDNPHLVSLQLELTSKCNERCVHCYIPHELKNVEMDLALFQDVIEQSNDMGLLSLTLSGGEPLAHSKIKKILRLLRDYDFSIRILSNLTLLDDGMLEEMRHLRIASIKVSLYSMNPEVHDSITQLPGSHKKTIRSIEKLVDSGFNVIINCPTMKENRADLKDVLEWGRMRGIRAVTDYIMMARYDRTDDNLEHRLSLEEIEPLIRNVIEGDEEYRTRIQAADFKKELERDVSNDPVCGVCVSSLCMVPNGNLYPCAGWQSFVLGNIRESPLREIWETSERVLYLRRLRRRDFKKCMQCNDRIFCSMCMVRNANENPEGDPLVVNEHFCKVAALNRRVVEEWVDSIKHVGEVAAN